MAKLVTDITNWKEFTEVWEATSDGHALLGLLDAIPKILPGNKSFYTEEYSDIPEFLLEVIEWMDYYVPQNSHYALALKAYQILTVNVLDEFNHIAQYLEDPVTREKTEAMTVRLLEFFGRPPHLTKGRKSAWLVGWSEDNHNQYRISYFIGTLAAIAAGVYDKRKEAAGIMAGYQKDICQALINARMFNSILVPEDERKGMVETLKEIIYFQMTTDIKPEWIEAQYGPLPENVLKKNKLPRKSWLMKELRSPDSTGFQIALTFAADSVVDRDIIQTLQALLLRKQAGSLFKEHKESN